MKFYRTMTPFKLISFDLDDTLYDNRQVITTAVNQFLQRFKQLSKIPDFDDTLWLDWKSKIEQEDPIFCEDVSAWRTRTMQRMLQHYGHNQQNIDDIIADCMSVFLTFRHRIDVPAQNLVLLNQLKQKYILAAVSNGNVDPQRIGLTLFNLSLRAGVDGRAKPEPALFHRLAQHFNIAPQQILHIGDNLLTDVQGAINAGCQAVWLNHSEQNIYQQYSAQILPTVEINDLQELSALCL